VQVFLQLWGGVFYTLNKILFSYSEHIKARGDEVEFRRWRVASWVVYIVGLPAWVILLAGNRAWIAAGVESFGFLSMLLGLVIAYRGKGGGYPKWLDVTARLCIPLGFLYSLYDFGGLNTVNQWLEIGLVVGFLVGTYLLAKERSVGYLWYVLMHVSAGGLMWSQGLLWLCAQQVLSLAFIVDAYKIASGQKKKETGSESKIDGGSTLSEG
jgi:hypothetical protein